MPAEVVLRTLKHVWLTLEKLNVPLAVMGGIALSAWKYVRATRDMNLLVGVRETDIATLLQPLSEAGIRPKRQPPLVNLGGLQVVQLLYEPRDAYVDLQIDLLLADSPYHVQALARRVPTRLPDLDLDVFVLPCEDLILHKLLAGRLLDRADAVALLRANRPTLDQDYLLHWVHALRLTTALSEVWREAFPGEELPGT